MSSVQSVFIVGLHTICNIGSLEGHLRKSNVAMTREKGNILPRMYVQVFDNTEICAFMTLNPNGLRGPDVSEDWLLHLSHQYF